MKSISLILTLFLFTGCSKILSPITSYTIDPSIHKSKYSSVCEKKTLRVGKVFTSQNLMLNQMKYSLNDYKQFAYTESKWANIPSKAINKALLRSIRDAKIFDSVSSYRSHTRDDLLLETNVYSFMQYYSKKEKKSYVDVTFSLSLVDIKKAKSLCSIVITKEIQSKTLDAEGGVIALNKALESVLEETNKWLSESCK